MNTTIANATAYRDLPLAMLTESPTNPRRIFEDDALKEMAETVRDKGVYQPLLVWPLGERNFGIVFGARRYGAAQLAEVATVPVRVITRASFQHSRPKMIQKSRSDRASFGCGWFVFKIASCCRRARTSKSSDRRKRKMHRIRPKKYSAFGA
jgi:hypothetical protein